jgi:hypothetical protein
VPVIRMTATNKIVFFMMVDYEVWISVRIIVYD